MSCRRKQQNPCLQMRGRCVCRIVVGWRRIEKRDIQKEIYTKAKRNPRLTSRLDTNEIQMRSVPAQKEPGYHEGRTMANRYPMSTGDIQDD